METRDDFLRRLGELTDAAWALAGLTAAVESGLVAALARPAYASELAERAKLPEEMTRRLLDLLVALGAVRSDEAARWAPAPGFAPYCSGTFLDGLRAELRKNGHHASALVANARKAAHAIDWSTADADLLRAHGVVSRATFVPIIEHLFPVMERLPDKLGKPGAAALDIGAGAAGASIALALAFPSLRVVALEPSEAALAEARRAIDAEGLDNVELRQGRAEELADEDAFDFAWIAQDFLGDDVIEPALAAALRSLKKGGWLLTSTIALLGEDLRPAASRLRNEMHGGGARAPEDIQKLMKAAGFNPVSRIPMPGEGTLRFTVGQKPKK